MNRKREFGRAMAVTAAAFLAVMTILFHFHLWKVAQGSSIFWGG